MSELGALLADDGTRRIPDPASALLLRRVVESLALMRPGRYTVYLGRPDPAAVRAEQDELDRLIRSARRAVVVTPPTSPLPPEAERRDPGLGWLASLWFSAVLGSETAMALVAGPDSGQLDQAWLLTEPSAVRRLVGAIEGELARPDPQLLAV
jgi:hypothetical protein